MKIRPKLTQNTGSFVKDLVLIIQLSKIVLKRFTYVYIKLDTERNSENMLENTNRRDIMSI